MDDTSYLGSVLRAPPTFFEQRHARFTAIRRDLHAHPEIGLEEHRTAALVAEQPHQWGIEAHTGAGRTGVVGTVHGRDERSGRSVGLRADMDALPMPEENDSSHRSKHAGLMRDCGHDGPTTMLLAAAEFLAALAERRMPLAAQS